jgi:subtilase family serine protease
MKRRKEYPMKTGYPTPSFGFFRNLSTMVLLTVWLVFAGILAAPVSSNDMLPSHDIDSFAANSPNRAGNIESNASASAEITRLWPVSNAKPGAASRLWADVMNSGTTALPADAVVMFYVRGPEFEKFVGSASVSGLAAGSSKWFSYDWAIPASAQAGDYTYWGIVYQGTVEISDWSDPQDFLVGIQAQVVGLWPVGEAKPGTTSKLWANVKNTGSAALPGNALVWFYVKGQGIDKFVGYTSASDLAAGSTKWYALDWAIPATAATGCYQYWAIVYLDNTTPISAWSSPQSFSIGTFTAQVTSLWPISNAKPGATVPFWTDVKNTGNAALPCNAVVRFYVRGPGIDTYIGSTSASGLAAGSTDWYAFNWAIPAAAAPGSYTYWAIVSLDNTAPISVWSQPQTFTVSGSSASDETTYL